MPAVARIGDPISCGDTIAQGSGNVFANGIPVTRINVDATAGHPCGPTTVMQSGSPSVYVNNIPTVRVGDDIVDHGTCDDPPHDGTVSVGSPNVFLNEGGSTPLPAPTGSAAVYEVLDEYNQPGVSRVDAGEQHDDDPDSDVIYVSYRKAAVEEAGGVPEQTVVETDPTIPPPPPGEVPSDCSDIESHVGAFPGSFQLSPNFTLAQLTTNTLVSKYSVRAQGGLTEKQIVCNLRALCINVLEPMKARYGAAMRINSGFRHGIGTSQHYKGQAVDVSFTDTPDTASSFARAKDIKDSFGYDQYIYEQNNSIWHHVSYNTVSNRRVVLTKPRGDRYLSGLHRVIV